MKRRREQYVTDGPEETVRLGASFGRVLSPGMRVALVGELGSGKTVFVKGVACGLGIKKDEAHSPTFVLFHIYHGKLPLYHFDFYRLNEGDDLEVLGLEDYLYDPNAVVVIEWADRIPAVLRSAHVRVSFKAKGESKRFLRFDFVEK